MSNYTNSSEFHSEKCTFLNVVKVHPTHAIVLTAIVTSVLNALTAVLATVGNFLMLFLMSRYRKLRTPPNILIASLCVSDLLVGALVQPLFCVRRCLDVFSRHNCVVRTAYAYGGFSSVMASLLGVSLISLDRMAALVMPFRYETLATPRRYTAAVIAIWCFATTSTALPFLGILNVRRFVYLIIIIVIVSTSTIVVCYSVIYSVARKQVRKMTTLHHTPRSKHGVLSRTNTCAVIVAVLLLCYAPQMTVLLIRGVIGDDHILVYIIDAWVDFIVFVNSSLNPIIYGCRMQEFRHAFLNLIGKDQQIRAAKYLAEQGLATTNTEIKKKILEQHVKASFSNASFPSSGVLCHTSYQHTRAQTFRKLQKPKLLGSSR